MADHYDLVILGSGSTAFAAALRARELGKTALMTEERTLGGTCVNRGCLPSKNLIEAARIVHEARHPRYPGLKPCAMEVDFEALISQKQQVVQGYRQKKYDSLLGGGIDVKRGHAVFVDPQRVMVDGRRISGDRILIATGSRPVVPPIEGLSEVPYLTSDLLTVGEQEELAEQPESLLMVGGGYIALELGQMFHRFGTRVTILERGEQVLARGYEPEVGQSIGNELLAEGVEVVTQARVQRVGQEDGQIVATVEVEGASAEHRAERLLIATGRRPNTDQIAIEKAGVELGPHGEVAVNDLLQTNVENISAAGDVIGLQNGSQLATPVGSQDGGIAAGNMLGDEKRSVDHGVVPRVIFTDPQIALVGMTEQQAVAAGHSCWCEATPMTLVPRAGAIRDTRGMIKMVADAATDEVLGVSMVGHAAGEVIHEAAMAMRFRATLRDFIELIHVYPTMAEALKIAAISRYKDPARLSCCAE